jgi:hypothetical protein
MYISFAFFPIPIISYWSLVPPKVNASDTWSKRKKKLSSFIPMKTNEFLMNQVFLLDYKTDKSLALSIHPKKIAS